MFVIFAVIVTRRTSEPPARVHPAIRPLLPVADLEEEAALRGDPTTTTEHGGGDDTPRRSMIAAPAAEGAVPHAAAAGSDDPEEVVLPASVPGVADAVPRRGVAAWGGSPPTGIAAVGGVADVPRSSAVIVGVRRDGGEVAGVPGEGDIPPAGVGSDVPVVVGLRAVVASAVVGAGRVGVGSPVRRGGGGRRRGGGAPGSRT